MINKIIKTLKKISPYGLAAFMIPVIIMIACYASLGIFWGSDRSVLASDAFSQFSNFHASFNNVMHGKQSLFYSWNSSLGLNYYALISYYLGGLFTPLVFFFDNSLMPDALYFLTLLKIGCASLAFWFYAKQTFKIEPWSQVALAVAYSLMSFVTAHSELIMWLDTFVYLPLIFLGINRVMDHGKPTLLFSAYFLLFVSNFYFGFMVGLFSFLYFWARTITDWPRYKQKIKHYLITSLLAGCASMIMVLPTVLDLRSNGETLTEITKLKTTATAFWDIVIKNMVGIYDTTKYGSIPFIYVGLLPLIFCLFYFISRKVPLKNKLAFGSLFVIITASFYFVPLNLFWHGMHAPNMFLFRYSFTFSFLVVMLAGYGLEHFTKEDSPAFTGGTLVLIAVYMMAFMVRGKNSYQFVTDQAFFITILFLVLYLIGIIFYQFYRPDKDRQTAKIQGKQLALLLLVLVSFEAVINTHSMLNGILDDWRYASRSLYEKPYQDFSDAIETISQKDHKEFYRMETLDPVSSNDSINYGFSGISMFSSIRNRHTSAILDDLGFRSRGTGLNVRYPNNTLLMDGLFGIKYNHSKQNPKKFGFAEAYKNKSYQMYQNDYALSLGTLTSDNLYQTVFPSEDNLAAQTNLINQLSGLNQEYFSFATPSLVDSTNTTVSNTLNGLVLKEVKPNIAKDVTWEVFVPANTQAYFSLYPTNFDALKSSTAEITLDGQRTKTQIDITGQYYNLGYYAQDTTVKFTVSFYGTDQVSFTKPPVILLDIPSYTAAMTTLAEQRVAFDVVGRKATAQVVAKEDNQVIMTTIPYDKGWSAYVDGKKVAIKPFKKAFLTLPIEKGQHEIKLVFLPFGFKLGVLCFLVGFSGFFVYTYLLKQATVSKTKTKKRHK